MKAIFHKNFKLYKADTCYVCKKCGVPYPVHGDTYVYKLKTTKAVDGKPAFRIYWLGWCGHMRMRGYTRYVNFERNTGKVEAQYDMKTFDEEEREEKAMYRELKEYAKAKQENRRLIY